MSTLTRRMSPSEAAEESRRHRQTIYVALEDGSLHGTQRVKRGRWLIKEACLDAWLDGIKCEHQAATSNVVALGSRRPVTA